MHSLETPSLVWPNLSLPTIETKGYCPGNQEGLQVQDECVNTYDQFTRPHKHARTHTQ